MASDSTAKRLIIGVSGTPGAGKSHFAALLVKRISKARIIEINDVVEREHLYSGADKLGSKIANLNQLNRALKKIIRESKGSVIIVGHLLADLELNQDITVIVRAPLKELIKRLEARGYQKEKIHENLLAEITDYCGVSCSESCIETYEVETLTQKSAIIKHINSLAASKPTAKPEKGQIDRLPELYQLVKSGNRYGL